ncbi:hypothetical protein [Paenibacillus sp. YPG26]|uniref:hypothetical protein n=1 Tax=Paenibacillus sp. YPG26 TaxID=2878915 RepID=UPI00203F8EAA|nr:hypothetical protein [Paenibacillus sp. YPG26]USB31628.1 hypothetical protein LDO05_09685 [Paenibacillus sp. YPG26]
MKIIIFCFIAILLIALYFLSIGLKDNDMESEKAEAIAFYEWGTAPDNYFGIAILKKNFFGWHLNGGGLTSVSPKEHKIGWSFFD